MTRPTISRTEPPGPLRMGLENISAQLGPQHGGDVYQAALDLANAGLDMTLDMYEKHGLGNPDKSIPPTYNAVKVLRDRGAFVGHDSLVQKTRL